MSFGQVFIAFKDKHDDCAYNVMSFLLFGKSYPLQDMGTRYPWYSNTVPCTNDCWNWLLFVKSQREVFRLHVGCSNTRWTSSSFSFVLQVVNGNKVLLSQNFMEKFEPSILTNKSTIKNLQILLVFMFFSLFLSKQNHSIPQKPGLLVAKVRSLSRRQWWS